MTDRINHVHRVCQDVSARLVEPASVVRTFTDALGDGATSAQLEAQTRSLGSGLPGVALLFGDCAPSGLRMDRVSHRHFTAAVQLLQRGPASDPGLHSGISGLALSLLLCRGSSSGYGRALQQLDASLSGIVAAMSTSVERDPIGDRARFDTISGLAGVGRYALLRGAPMRDTLMAVLKALVALGKNHSVDGHHIPGYWTLTRPRGGLVASPRAGNLNLGMSHGIAGPLALLALAHKQGVSVPGQLKTMEMLAAIYRDRARTGEHGVSWPDFISWDAWLSGDTDEESGRTAWCYGSLGIASALRLAADATGQEELRLLAHSAVESMVRVPLDQWPVRSAGLCHGWAGALNCLKFFATGPHAEEVNRVRGEIADVVLRLYDEQEPFGFGYPDEDGRTTLALPGFLDGATGVVLALDAYASGSTEAAPWDAALLLA
ncbi:lanthionine synthetase C family protein [Streptomyces sp. NPDC014685]|uniref:lanthionine synthetase C family protein n=1 Tax=Streptomyces sp. NPDC014685 TaxID=3364881 RepID=UPI0036FC0D7F